MSDRWTKIKPWLGTCLLLTAVTLTGAGVLRAESSGNTQSLRISDSLEVGAGLLLGLEEETSEILMETDETLEEDSFAVGEAELIVEEEELQELAAADTAATTSDTTATEEGNESYLAENELYPAQQEGEEEIAEEEHEELREVVEYAELVVADVNDKLNVRSEPDEESEKVGYLYADCGGEVLERQDGWTKISSGELTGWAKDEYLLFGEEAAEAMSLTGRMAACVQTQTLRIRKEPSTESIVLDIAGQGEVYTLLEGGLDELEETIADGWVAIEFEGGTAYVSTDYVEIYFDYDKGETLEQIEEREAAAAAKAAAASTQQAVTTQGSAVAAEASDVMLLAALIQCEAGSEIYEGKVAVGAVVVNRVKSASYPDTVYGVIFASGQFGPAQSGKVARLIENGSVNETCIQAATEALAGVTNIGTATHFRRAGSTSGIVIGNHVFW